MQNTVFYKKEAIAYYEYFGLRIQSDLQLPWLSPLSAFEQADLYIECGSTPQQLPEPTAAFSSMGNAYEFLAIDGNFSEALITVPKIGKYWIHAGSRIVVEPATTPNQEALLHHLTDQAIVTALLQRGFFPIHGSAVATPTGTYIFTGPSGAGKSTTVAIAASLGHNVVADDLCLIYFDSDEQPYLLPETNVIRLWDDSFSAVNSDLKFEKAIASMPNTIKRSLAVQDAAPVEAEALRVRGLFDLQYSTTLESEVQIAPIQQATARLELLHKSIFGLETIKKVGLQKPFFLFASRLIKSINIVTLYRKVGPIPKQSIALTLREEFSKPLE